MFFCTSKLFFGQVHYGHLLVPGQVDNFDISTSLKIAPVVSLKSFDPLVLESFSWSASVVPETSTILGSNLALANLLNASSFSNNAS